MIKVIISYFLDSAILKTHFKFHSFWRGFLDGFWHSLLLKDSSILLSQQVSLYIVIVCMPLFCLDHWLLKARDYIVLLFFWILFFPSPFLLLSFLFYVGTFTFSCGIFRSIMKIRDFDINHKQIMSSFMEEYFMECTKFRIPKLPCGYCSNPKEYRIESG